MFLVGGCSFVAFSTLVFDDQAQKPNVDEIFDDFSVSVCAGSGSGCGAGIALDAIVDGPSLGKADTAAISRLYSSSIRRFCCSLNSSPNVATPIVTPATVAKAIGRMRPAMFG